MKQKLVCPHCGRVTESRPEDWTCYDHYSRDGEYDMVTIATRPASCGCGRFVQSYSRDYHSPKGDIVLNSFAKKAE